jgi:DNA-binding transcriptional MerR regulator
VRIEKLTVEQLAAEVDLPTSTIRMYQTKGLLHAPRRQGRTAHYNATHVERLRVVQRLQSRGFSLPAIAELIAARDQGASVAAVLGLSGSAGPDDWVPIPLRELGKVAPMRELRFGLLRRAGALGLLKWRRGRPHSRRWAWQSGVGIVGLNVPPDEVLDQFAKVRIATDAIAADFVDVFERRLWPKLADSATADEQLDHIRGLLLGLTETAEGVVLGALRESIRDAAERFADRHGLLPDDGSEPVWAKAPVPSLVEGAGEGTGVVDEETVHRYLEGDEEEDSP